MPVRIYQRQEDELWVVVWGDHFEYKQIADSEMEAYTMSEKISFVLRAQELTEHLAAVMDGGPDLVQLFFDRAYGSGGANEIADADIASTSLTAAQVVSAITLLQNFDKFCNAGNPANDAYRVTVNQVRRL